MMDKEYQKELAKYIGDLSKLSTNIDPDDKNLYDSLYETDSKEYVRGIKTSKPETILSDKLLKPIIKLAGISNFPEARVGDGWVDFILESSGVMAFPVALELKALHNRSGYVNDLSSVLQGMKNEFSFKNSNQIIKYIVGKNGVEYVILTNLLDVYIFDKSCVVNFEPIVTEKFSDLIDGISTTSNISDYLRRRTQEVQRHDLDKLFIADLKKWYNYLQELQWKEDPKNNSVLLLNKLIFALTLEDFIIIDYRYTWDAFVTAYNKWKTKGTRKVLEAFFKDLDDFIYEYYDTELFVPSSNILSKLEPTRENYDRALDVLRRVGGFDERTNVFSGGLYSYSFRLVDEDVFGKSYETFLAENRKDSGIYYTPKVITKHMAEKLVTELFHNIANSIISDIDENRFDSASKGVDQLVSIAIIDPACGSGPFLIGVLREIYDVYQGLLEKTNWVENQFKENSLILPKDVEAKIDNTKLIRERLGVDDKRTQRELISKIILRHIFGVDSDKTALNVAKVNLWKEAIKLDPKSFYYQELPEDENHILPDLELNFVSGDSVVSLQEDKIIEIMQREFSDELAEMVELHQRYLAEPTESDIPTIIEDKKQRIKERLTKDFNAEYPELGNPLFFPLEFFFLYLDENVKVKDETKRGFTGVIGNPPWNNLKPNKKEFAAKHPEIFGEGISKYSMPGKEFEELFIRKISDPDANALWESYVRDFRALSEYVSKNYPLQYSGDNSLQKIFTERFMQLSKRAFCLLVPSNLHTDEGTYLLRKEIMENWELKELISFENRGKVWFPDIHAQFKFDMITASREKTGKPFKAKFYVTDWNEINDAFSYPIGLVEKVSPGVLGITEFRSRDDIPIVSKIRGGHKLLRETGLVIRSELHETNDKDIFSYSENGLILYEGKMMHQYNQKFSTNTYFVDEIDGRKRLLGRATSRILEKLKTGGHSISKERIQQEIIKGTIKMDYERERLVFRDVAGATNERTLISCIIPAKNFLANTLPYVEPFEVGIKDENIIVQELIGNHIYYIQALFNSFVLDYYVRQRVTSHLNFFFVYELPIPEVNKELESIIIDMSKHLINNNDVNLRARLESTIAREVFGLNFAEMEIILNSFIYGNVDKELTGKILEEMQHN